MLHSLTILPFRAEIMVFIGMNARRCSVSIVGSDRMLTERGATVRESSNRRRERKRRRGRNRPRPEGAESLDHSVRIGDLIPGVMAELGLVSQLWLSELEQEWGALVGESVAKHTRPGRLDQDRLIVFVDNSAWLHERSRYGETEMLSAVRVRFGDKVRSLVLRLDPGERPAS